MAEFQNETFDEIYEYRGVKAEIWNDDYGQQKIVKFVNDPIFGNQEIGLGCYNFAYKDDIDYIIDQKLDTIYRFELPYFGAKIEWFDNNGYRDIRLVYRNRILKIFLTPETYVLTDIEKQKIITLSTSILQRLLQPITDIEVVE